MQLLTVGFRCVGRHRYTGRLSVGKYKEQITLVICGGNHLHHEFPVSKSQFCRNVIAHDAGFGFRKVAGSGFVNLLLVGEKQQFDAVGGFQMTDDLVFLFQLLFAAHAERSRCDLFEVTTLRQKQVYRIIGNIFFVWFFLDVRRIIEQCLSGLSVFFCGFFQLCNDDFLHLFRIRNGFFQFSNFLFQLVNLLRAFQNVFSIQVPQFDLRHIFRLNLINAEADHQIWYNICFFDGFPHDANCLINVQQDFFQTKEQMQFFLFFLEVEHQTAADTFQTECGPFLQNFSHAHNAGCSADQNIEVAGVVVLQRCHAEQLLHDLFRIRATL